MTLLTGNILLKMCIRDRSTQLLSVIDAISEGPVEGPVDGLKSVLLNSCLLYTSSGWIVFLRMTGAAVISGSTVVNHPQLTGDDKRRVKLWR